MVRRGISRAKQLLFACVAITTALSSALAGPVPRIVHTVHGKVLAVDAITHRLTVEARCVEEWMGVITTIYRVDNGKILHQVKAGDQIMGKVYPGETALHHVEIVAVAARAAGGGAGN